MASAPPAKLLHICVVTKDRHEVSLMCAVALLRLQTMLMTSEDPVRADMHFVPTLDDALNRLHSAPEAVGALVVEGTMGFDPALALDAMRSGLPVVVGVYPLPLVDWNRVKTQPKGEAPQHWGNIYNVRPSGPETAKGYVPVSEATLGVAWITSDAVRSIATRHPEIFTADRASGAFARAGVYDGVRQDEHQRFLSLWAGPVYADAAKSCTSSGPAEFGGCVGARAVLR
jgi:hypothetical protein